VEQLRDRVMKTALYIEFQVKNQDQVLEAQRVGNAALDPERREEMTAIQYQSHLINYIAAACCLRLTNSEGKVIEGPLSVEQMVRLRESLITAENTKLVAAMEEAINMGNQWAADLDAGFPRRSADVA
jgi:hypothetical protein